MFDSDSLYHRLFSHPQMVEDLVREFVPDAVAAGLEFSGLQRINSKFHVDRDSAQRRESDVIWRLPTRDGVDIYLYLLVEFQTASDWWMAVRAQVYQGLLWQQVIEEKQLKSGARLPPVLLLVLYNGQPRWKAPTEVSELIALPPDSPLWHWQPQVRYYLLDMGAFAGKELAQRPSLATLLFRLERRQASKELGVLVGEVIEWFRQHPDYDQLGQLFREIIHQASVDFGMRLTSGSLEEMRAMLWTYEDSYKQEWQREGRVEGRAEGRIEGRAEGLVEGKAEGLAEGLAEGKAEGLVEGKAEGLAEGKAEGLVEGKAEGEAKGLAQGETKALVRLLVKRFGPLDPSLYALIQAADLATIESWFDRAIDATDLTAVFGPPR